MLLNCCHLSQAENLSIGNKLFNIPTPKGYVRVTADMTPLYDYFVNNHRQNDSLNDLIAFYIPEEKIPSLMSEDSIDLEKNLTIKVSSDFKNSNFSHSYFLSFKKKFRNNISKSIKRVKKIIQDKYNAPKLVLLEPHNETRNSISYSMYSKLDKDAETRASTTVFLFVNHRIFTVNCHASKNDLGTTRKICEDWSNSMIKNN